MANAAPATVTITSTTGPGQALTAAKYTDVNNLELDFLHNVVRITRAGAGGLIITDYSAIGTITATVSGGVTSVTLS
jgi:hypothetical protein